MKKSKHPARPADAQSELPLVARASGPQPEPKLAPTSGREPFPAVQPSSTSSPDVEPAPEPPARRKPERRATAEMLAARQRDISVSEFFTKNRHLLGFDNPAKALLTSIKEAVDNSLDACEEAGILPDVNVEVAELSEGRFRVVVEDNGPGIVREQVPKIFAKLLYGSKFHRLKQARGQQGIGISAAGLYALLTTGKPIVIVSKTGPRRPARRVELRIDTRRNKPEVLVDEEMEWDVDHGTRVELELAGTYRGGRTSIDSYLEQTVVANPHLRLSYLLPKAEAPVVFERASSELPREPTEIKPHPHGVELGVLIRMMQESGGATVKKALVDSFSRVSAAVADQVCAAAGVWPRDKATKLTGDQVEALHQALGQVKVLAPPASCVVPIGEPLVEAGLRRRFAKADFLVSVTRPPSVYRGNPFVVECGLAYGGDLPADEPADVMRFANRVPLQYQPKACAMTEAVYDTNWKAYELAQPKGSLPVGPVAILIHLASVWVPFTNEAKEAVAHYPELLREMKLALQECGRRLAAHLRARSRAESAARRRSVFERYIPEVSAALSKITGADADRLAGSFAATLGELAPVLEAAAAAAGGEPAPNGEPTPNGDPSSNGQPTPSMPPPDAADEGLAERARTKRSRAAAPPPAAPGRGRPKDEPGPSKTGRRARSRHDDDRQLLLVT